MSLQIPIVVVEIRSEMNVNGDSVNCMHFHFRFSDIWRGTCSFDRQDPSSNYALDSRMTVRGFTLIAGKELQLRRVVLEARFSRSGAFYSRFGKMLDVLAETRPNWFFNSDMKSGLGGNFVCVASGLDASIGDNRIVASLASKPDLSPYDESEIHEFASECDFLVDLYVSNSRPAERTRIGFRQFYESDFDSTEQANQWVHSLGLFKIASALPKAFSSKVTELNFHLVLEHDSHCTRLAVETAKREVILDRNESAATIRSHTLSEKQRETLLAAEKKSAWVRRRRSTFATVDIDSFIESPSDEILTGEFIKTHFRSAITNFMDAYRDPMNETS